MRSMFIILAAAACHVSASADAGEVGEAYELMLNASGYLLRSSTVCDQRSARPLIKAAGAYGSVGDLPAFNRAFPKKSAEWLQAGGSRFNRDVLKEGVTAACKEALDLMRSAP